MNQQNRITGTTSYLDRQALTRRLEENLEAFLEEYEFKVIPFGHPVILQDNTWIKSNLKRIKYKANLAAVMMRFCPDYIVYKETEPKAFFFMDAKASITPIFFNKHVERIKNHYKKDNKLSKHDIGEIEREAWLSYNKFYSGNNVAIVIGTPYNPRLLLAEWVSNIECMWCLKEAKFGNPIPWECDKCPIFTNYNENKGFGVLVNEFASGSGTPHTNIHFGKMRTLKDFLYDEFKVEVDDEDYKLLIEDIKKWDINKPRGKVSWSQFNGTIKELKKLCPWLKCRREDKYIPCPGKKQESIF